jgi:arginyl-tRNA synthetase
MLDKVNIEKLIRYAAVDAIKALYAVPINAENITINETKEEFEGEFTVVLFNLLKILKRKPDEVGEEIGAWLIQHHPLVFSSYNVIKGFLNLTICSSWYCQFLKTNYDSADWLIWPKKGKKVMVEYSSPNTNKPLHLGHLRNNFLGFSASLLLEAAGYDVVRTCIVNDRGIHICKSMIAWMLMGNNETPQSAALKGDHLVGKYYVLFNEIYKKEVAFLIDSGMPREMAEKEAAIMTAANQLLVDWEAGQPEVLNLWNRMNAWVYEGFDETYKAIGSSFDKIYYESNTYLLGKEFVDVGMQQSVFYQKPDGSIWADLTSDGLDEKIVRRSDGTSVYITQDLGLVVDKFNEYGCDRSIYVVGDEQNYHFKVLKILAQKLDLPNAEGIYHLSYGMVELPDGKMKSREGTVVDADDIVKEMIITAREKAGQTGKLPDLTPQETERLHQIVGLGALKFFLLRVDPKKKIIFNPSESIDLHGYTAPFIQYTYARIKSILRKNGVTKEVPDFDLVTLYPAEKNILQLLETFPDIIREAAEELDPSKLCMSLFQLSQKFNTFYDLHSVTHAESVDHKNMRLQLVQLTAHVIKKGMSLLHIEVPEKM